MDVEPTDMQLGVDGNAQERKSFARFKTITCFNTIIIIILQN